MNRKFKVFGEDVEVLVSSEETGGTQCVIHQTCPPGGGPPPHFHKNEAELFSVISGEFEIFDGDTGTWTPLPLGEFAFAKPGSKHTFRNAGSTDGVIQCIATGGKLDEYLEKLSAYTMPQDVEQVMTLSAEYGIAFLPPPSNA